MDVNISQLRQHLPEYLARARQGERIRILSRGRVVAELGPPTTEAVAGAAAREQTSPLHHDDPAGPAPAGEA